ncbi:hypothetical protein AB0K14_14590 [Actinosynnema sp. NPDC050801]|uniref:hypothetical protein n=1 Tax=unclassified Actinosynnema TaxID=2637065 RepID=UPI003406DFD3
MNDVNEVRGMLAPALEGDTGPRHSPEEVLRSAHRATARRRAVVVAALSVGVVLATGTSVLVGVTTSSTVASASSAAPTTAVQPPTDVRPVRTTLGHADELTAALAAADVIPDGLDLVATLPDGTAPEVPPLHFRPFGEDTSGGYLASAVVVDAKGRATLTVYVRSATAPDKCTAESRCPIFAAARAANLGQSTVTSVDGVEVAVARDHGTGLPGMVSVTAHLPDGTVVKATVVTEVTVLSQGVPYPEPATRDSVPLTERQLIDLVKKPGFRYRP